MNGFIPNDATRSEQCAENRYTILTYSVADDRDVVFLDIDNTLYSASSKIADAMGERIHAYFTSLGLDDDEASAMHLKYYKTYGELDSSSFSVQRPT